MVERKSGHEPMEFDPLDHRTGLCILDPVEKGRFELYTPDAIDPTPAGTDEFYFPVDTAVGFETTALEVPNHISAVVRTSDGDIVADETHYDHYRLPAGLHLLELQSTPMKLYVAVEDRPELNHADGTMRVQFEDAHRVRVGARSFHDSPVGTITVPDDVRDEMAALSMLGSALKTTSCERSFPTLRGHPPLFERGDSFEVPSDIDAPDTGVELVLPPDRKHVYRAASLAYYLGADLVAGTTPRLVAGDFEYSLDGPDGYEATINRVLRQVFFLDCLTRTEGYYQVELHERTQVEPLVDLDFEALYDQSIAEQLPEYLSVPYDVLEPHVLDWHLTTDVVPTGENFPALPYFAKELSVLRVPANPKTQTTRQKPAEQAEFFRAAPADGAFTRSASEDWDFGDDVFQADSADTIEHAWVGDGYPLGVNKVSLDALRRQIDRTVPEDATLDIHVVNNDPRMDEGAAVSEFYGLRDLVSFDVSVHETTSQADLADLFESDADFLHYIGHVDDDGFLCADGYLDADSLGTVNVDAFFLNACKSYRQGELLVERGSLGGVVTLVDVVNARATKVGRTMARLLNSGFSLRSALSLATDDTATPASEYMTLGDGGVTLCQGESGVPLMYRVHRDDDGFILEHRGFPTSNYRLGAIVASNIENTPRRYLASGSFAQFDLSVNELEAVLNLGLLPLESNGDVYWSDEISVSDM